jgi:hypothetical protein
MPVMMRWAIPAVVTGVCCLTEARRLRAGLFRFEETTMADQKALRAIGLGFSAVMLAVVMTAVLVVANAQRTVMADAVSAVATQTR